MTGTLRALRDQLHALADGRAREDADPLPGDLGAAMDRSMTRVTDITDQLRVSEAISRLTIDTAVEGIVRVDEEGNVTGTNPAAAALVGTEMEEMIGRPLAEVVPLEGLSVTESGIELVTDRDTHLRNTDGEMVDVLISTRRVSTGDGHHRVMLFIRDISDRKRMEEQLAWEALHDPLTALPNRAALDGGLAHDGEEPEVGAVLFIDLDRFKEVNDTLGHEVGDDLLRAVAGRIRENVRSGDVVVRMGGDEFVLVRSPSENPDDAERVAWRLIRALEEPFELGEHTVSISASIGMVHADGEADMAELIRRADQAMYAAKNDGRGRVSRYEPDIASETDGARTT